jgi:acetate kinase
MKILVLNCGSSSIKFQLLQMNEEIVIASGMIDRIGEETSKIKLEITDGEKIVSESNISNHEDGVNKIIELLLNPKLHIIADKSEIIAVGHRVVHGANIFSKSVIINDSVIEKIESINDLAPLHNPANLLGIKAAQTLLPNATHCATFDTAFHQTMPPQAYMYGVPYKYYEEYKIRRYGFHGSSHRYVSEEAAKLSGLDYDACKTIVCHLGNGSSITAIKNGKSVDTSMGLTPLEGLMMGTRVGSLDLGAAIHIMRKENLSIDELDKILNKNSGFKGIAGISDMRDLKIAALNGDEKAKLVLNMLTYRVKKYIGFFAAGMEGVDCVAFTGGIGENNSDLRNIICTGLEFMGIEFDSEKNLNLSGVNNYIISKDSSRVKVMVIQTNEEIIIARDTYKLVNLVLP